MGSNGEGLWYNWGNRVEIGSLFYFKSKKIILWLQLAPVKPDLHWQMGLFRERAPRTHVPPLKHTSELPVHLEE